MVESTEEIRELKLGLDLGELYSREEEEMKK